MIKEYRKRHKYSQQDIADILHCHRGSISKAERGIAKFPNIERNVRRLIALDNALEEYQATQNLIKPERVVVTPYKTKKSFLGRVIDGLKRIF